jgi:hypothetical protein
MRTFVALVRGMNVGATRKLPMADLRSLCLELGLKSPQTYIQSGNPIVDARRRRQGTFYAAGAGAGATIWLPHRGRGPASRGLAALRCCQPVCRRPWRIAEDGASLSVA